MAMYTIVVFYRSELMMKPHRTRVTESFVGPHSY